MVLNDANNDGYVDIEAKFTEADIIKSNGEYFAKPGQIQSTIDAAVAESNVGSNWPQDNIVVNLLPRTTYNPATEVHVKPGVFLKFNGAKIIPSTDHNVLFLDNGSCVRDAYISVANLTTFTSDVIVLDTARSASGKYGDTTAAQINGYARGAQSTGNGVALRDTAGVGITLRTRVNVDTLGFGNAGILAHTPGAAVSPSLSDGWINSVELGGIQTGSAALIRHTGDGNFVTQFRGALQTTANTTHAIWHEGTGESVRVMGKLWDPHRSPSSPLRGPNITLFNPEVEAIENNMQAAHRAEGQYGIDYSPGDAWKIMSLYDFNKGRQTDFGISNTGSLEVWEDGRSIWQFGSFELGTLTQPGPNSGFACRAEDLSQRTGRGPNELAFHSGAGAIQADYYRWVAGTGNWVRVGDTTTTITPAVV